MKGTLLLVLMGACLPIFLLFATEIDPGPVSGDWYASGNPYNVNGEINVPTASTLNIHEGVEVIFQGHYKFIINGILEANGLEGNSILFTAADPLVGWHSLRFISAQDISHLSYCIVQYGIAVGSTTADSCGGGIYCHRSNVYISNCQITNNTGYLAGGGVLADSSANITLSNCEISSNSTVAELTSGGGLCFFEGCDVNMTQCTVTDNHIPNGVGMGGGVRVIVGCNAIITDCEIAFNTCSQGGGVDIFQSDVTLIGCDIHDNTAENTINGAGGVCVVSFDDITNISMYNCKVIGNQSTLYAGGIWFASYQTGQVIGTMQNCVVSDNHAAWRIGGIYNQYCDQLTIDQCTVSGNSSGDFGAEITVNDASSTISNTIVEGSSSNSSIYFYNAPNASLLYCDVYNNVGANFGGSVPAGLGVIWGTNANGDPCDVFMNIFLDPLFVVPGIDFHLDDWSPCIGAGDPATPPGFDIEGNPRPDPPGSIVDIGAYENQREIPLPVELTTFEAIAGDGEVALQWHTESETNNDHFVLYKRVVGNEDFSAMAQVEGSGTTSLPQDYEYIDRQVINGITYEYRISDVDINGVETLHDIVVSATPVAGGVVPTEYALHQNYPNPFNPYTTITYDVKDEGWVTLAVFDILGREVVTVVNESRYAGRYSVEFNAADLASGVYFYQLKVNEFSDLKKMVVLK